MWLDVMPGSQGNTNLRRQYEKPLWVLMGVVGLVLLIACANLASLLTARAAARQKEIAIRLAIGSSRGRMLRQLLTESLLLSAVGGLAGLALAVTMVKGLLAFLPPSSPATRSRRAPDPRMLAFTFGLSLLTGLAFGLVPALQSTQAEHRARPQGSRRQYHGQRGAGEFPQERWLRRRSRCRCFC